MNKLLAVLVGVVLAVGVAGSAAAQPRATRALQVTAIFVGATCQGGDFANVKLTAQPQGAVGDVQYKWDFTNDGTFDTPILNSPRVQHLYGDELTITARVGARDSSGATAMDTVTFSTPRCG